MLCLNGRLEGIPEEDEISEPLRNCTILDKILGKSKHPLMQYPFIKGNS